MSPPASLHGQRKHLRRISDGVSTQCAGRGSCSGQEKWQGNELAQDELEENVERKGQWNAVEAVRMFRGSDGTGIFWGEEFFSTGV